MRISPKAAWVNVILRELEVPVNVATKRERIAMQKAIYLAQTRGVDLGFRFSWYLNGPYSTALADTYYLLDEDPALYKDFTPSKALRNQLKLVKELVAAKPAEANLADWLEAVGSLDFMVRVMARSLDESVDRCKTHKPHLTALFDPAKSALIAKGFQGTNEESV